MSNKSLENIFKFVSAILIGIAVFFYWQDSNDSAFIAGALGVVSFFLSYRFRLKEGLELTEIEKYEKNLDELNMNRNMLKDNPSLFDIEEENNFDKVKEKILKDQ